MDWRGFESDIAPFLRFYKDDVWLVVVIMDFVLAHWMLQADELPGTPNASTLGRGFQTARTPSGAARTRVPGGPELGERQLSQGPWADAGGVVKWRAATIVKRASAP